MLLRCMLACRELSPYIEIYTYVVREKTNLTYTVAFSYSNSFRYIVVSIEPKSGNLLKSKEEHCISKMNAGDQIVANTCVPDI